MIKDKNVLRKLDIIFGVAMLLASVVMLILSAAMPVKGLGGAMESSFWVAPGALPVVVSSVLILLSAVLIWGGVRSGVKITAEDFAKVGAILKSRPAKYIYLCSAMLIAYVFALGNRTIYGWLGDDYWPYRVVTFVYLSVFMLALRAGKWYAVLPIAAATAFGVGFVFEKYALILLP